MMSSANLFATDIYLPALPDMATHFNCSQTEIQLSITVFLLGFASCQLVAGVLSDRFGRKKVALIGFTIFTIASLLCAYATNLQQFYGFRLLQALGGGVGSVISRALIADRYDRQQSAKIFSTTFPIIGLSAAITPSLGGHLTHWLGWRANFLVMAIFGLGILFIAFYYLNHYSHSTVNQEKLKNSKANSRGIQSYFEVISNIEFLGFALIICASFCVFRSFTVESPFVFNKEGYAAEEIGHFYTAISIAYVAGNLIAKKLINKMILEKILSIGISIFVLGGASMIVASLIYAHHPLALLIPMFIISLANGFLFPIGSAGAMSAVPGEFTGTASGVMGAIQCILAAFCINWVGKLCQGEALFMSIFIGTLILVGFSSYLLLIVYKPKTRMTTT